MGKNILALALALGLLCLCIFPARSLHELSVRLETGCDQTLLQAQQEEWQQAAHTAKGMLDAFLQKRKTLMLYLNHADLTELEISLASCVKLCDCRDTGALVQELESVVTRIRGMYENECFRWENLL